MQYLKKVRACEKWSSTTFIKVDTSYRMAPLPVLYIVTLTYIFSYKILGNI